MAKAKRDAERICGKTFSEIRKAYFTGKLQELLNSVQAESEWEEKDIRLLGMELERLKADAADKVTALKSTFTGPVTSDDGVRPPSVEELMGGASDAEWRAKADAAIAYIDAKMDEVRHMIAKREKVPPSFWLDTASVINSYQSVLDRDQVFKEQKYRAMITKFMDEAGCSRAESEERAKLTPEYAAYRYMTLQRERIQEFIMLGKKHDAKDQPYGRY